MSPFASSLHLCLTDRMDFRRTADAESNPGGSERDFCVCGVTEEEGKENAEMSDALSVSSSCWCCSCSRLLFEGRCRSREEPEQASWLRFLTEENEPEKKLEKLKLLLPPGQLIGREDVLEAAIEYTIFLEVYKILLFHCIQCSV